jgi:hypothetical protein
MRIHYALRTVHLYSIIILDTNLDYEIPSSFFSLLIKKERSTYNIYIYIYIYIFFFFGGLECVGHFLCHVAHFCNFERCLDPNPRVLP